MALFLKIPFESNDKHMKKVLLLVLTASIGGLVAVGAYKLVEDDSKTAFGQRQPVQFASIPGSPESSVAGVDFTTAASMVTPAVVHIKTTYEPQASAQTYDPFRDFFGDKGFHDFFGERGQRGPSQGSGSGVIIASDGYIITNNHVVREADKIEVILNDNRSYSAKVIGIDPNTDLALIKVNESGLPFVTYGNSDNVKVGQWVLAVGNPFNLTSTVTAGIVSAKGRNINIIGSNDPGKKLFPIESFIQTDAAVNPGNSGGALINTNGELIGINTAIASQTGSYAGYSFAIPVNIAKKVMNDLLEFGTVQRAFLGVSIQDITAKLAEEKDLADTKGVYIAEVSEGGSADAAGIKSGDVVKKIGDVTINTSAELQEQIGLYRPGDQLNVTLVRAKKEKILKVLLKNEAKNFEVVKKDATEMMEKLGAELESLSSAEKKGLRVAAGVKIAKIKAGKFLSNGIREGFIITKLDNKAVSSPEDIENILSVKANNMLAVEGFYPTNPNSTYIFSFSIK